MNEHGLVSENDFCSQDHVVCTASDFLFMDHIEWIHSLRMQSASTTRCTPPLVQRQTGASDADLSVRR